MRAIVRATDHVFVSLGPVALTVLSPFILLYLIFAIYAMIMWTVYKAARWLVVSTAWLITYIGTWRRRNRRADRMFAELQAADPRAQALKRFAR